MCKKACCTCTVVVLLIKPIVFWRSRSLIDHGIRQNVVKISVVHSPSARVPLQRLWWRVGVLPVISVCKKTQKQHFDVLVIGYWTDTQHDGIYLLNKIISLFGLVFKAYITFVTVFFSTEKNVLGVEVILLPPIMVFFSSMITFI